MAGNGRRGDDVLIAGLLAGQTVQKAAEGADVSERTAFRRLADEGFRRKCEAAGIAIREHAVAMVNAASTRAANTLLDLMENGPPSIRLGAAKAILQMAVSQDDAQRKAISTQPPAPILTPAQRRFRIEHLMEEARRIELEKYGDAATGLPNAS